MDELGRGYVIEHCVAALRAKARRDAYEFYTTDLYRAIAMSLGMKGVKRFAEIVEPKPEDTRSAEEIVEDITARAGLKVVG